MIPVASMSNFTVSFGFHKCFADPAVCVTLNLLGLLLMTGIALVKKQAREIKLFL